MNDQDLLNNALKNFNDLATEKFKKDKVEEQKNEIIINEKKKVLLPIRNLFRRFKEIGLVVPNAKTYNFDYSANFNNENINPEVFFDFSQRSTIGKHAPGIDFIIRNPCEMVISIPNKNNIERYGVVSISVVESKCQHLEYIMNKKFKNIEEVVNALSSFFALNAIRINNPNNSQK